MPIYRCLRGDCDNLALLEPDCFVLRDARGRNWLCYERPGEALSAEELPESVAQLCQLQARLHQAGQSRVGTAMCTHVCRDREELARALATEGRPPRRVYPPLPADYVPWDGDESNIPQPQQPLDGPPRG